MKKTFRQTNQTRNRGGLTIVELLVCIGIASFLMALLLPAVQSARASARRIECVNRLKQIITATQAFEATHRHFPGYSTARGIDYHGRIHWNVCPLVEILPYLEQSNVFDQIDRNRWIGSFDAYGSGQLLSGMNAEFAKLTIPVYQCPSDHNLPGSGNYRINLGTGADWYTRPPAPPSNSCFDPNNGNGAFATMETLTTGKFTDGLSNTVFYSERVIGDGDSTQFSPWRDYSQVTQGWVSCSASDLQSTCQGIAGIATKHASFAGHTWLFPSKAHTAYDHILPPNSRIPDCARDGSALPSAGNSAISARSQHAEIVNAALGDGSVRSVSENIDQTVWHKLGSRNGHD
ncbi:MAG: DUF1559 domain-containing protein [Planctomycetaceae bacterium]|nr:DUF1559 domain-containing protein [Planctomycetaceae bacterium]